MITDFMASAKQIAWRKKFAKMAKSGKFKSAKTPKVRNDPYPKAGGSIADHLRREIMIFINAEDRLGGSKASTKTALKNITREAWEASGV